MSPKSFANPKLSSNNSMNFARMTEQSLSEFVFQKKPKLYLQPLYYHQIHSVFLSNILDTLTQIPNHLYTIILKLA